MRRRRNRKWPWIEHREGRRQERSGKGLEGGGGGGGVKERRKHEGEEVWEEEKEKED